MITITTLEHAFASAASDVVKVARFVETKVLPELLRVQADSATVEAVANLVSPQAANIERVGFAVLGTVIKAVQDAQKAAGAGGLNVALDADLVADVKSIMASVTKGAALNYPVAPLPKAA